jgi:sugar lactone lactonase YvrE
MFRAALFLAAVLSFAQESAWRSEPFTPQKSFTGGIEGPACDAAGNLYLVSLGREGTIGKVTPEGQLSLFAVVPDGGAANGLRFDSNGWLIAADYVNHHVWRIDAKTGAFLEDLAADWKGLPFKQPNDLGIASDDTLYFTDPDWKNRAGGGRIFMIAAPPARRTVLLDENLATPNGITVSPDDRRVYVGQSHAHNILVYDRRPDGALHNKRVFIDFPAAGVPATAVPDGIRCDSKGNLWVSMVGLGKVLVVQPDGTLHPRAVECNGRNPANVTFCGPDGRTLYITEKQHGRVEKFRAPFPGAR